MKRLLYISLALYSALSMTSFAQWEGPGNESWVIKWEKIAPTSYDPEDPNAWMFGENSYTGLAFDSLRKVVYVVSPSNSRIYAFNRDDGSSAMHIGNPSQAPAGQLFVDPSVIQGGYNDGLFSMYKIDVDDEGRIYVCNVAAPGTPFRIYRWETDKSSPQLIFQVPGNQVQTLLGTAFDVQGMRHFIDGVWRDSTRIFTCTGPYGSGVSPDELWMLVPDGSPSAPYVFWHSATVRNPNPSGIRYFGSGLTVEGSWTHSPLWVSAPGGVARKIPQPQPGTSGPLVTQPSIIDTLMPSWIHSTQLKYGSIDTTIIDTMTVGGLGSILKSLAFNMTNGYGANYNRFLLRGDQSLPPVEWGFEHRYTGANLIDASPYRMVGLQITPPFGMQQTSALHGSNRIADIAGGFITSPREFIWPVLHSRNYLLIFYLSSSNGIGCYQPRHEPMDPVELSAFTAHSDGNAVQLNWTTATETNNYGFDIERSFGGKHATAWEQIGFVEGNGTTTLQQEYSWSDPLTPAHKQAGIIQYRLKQTDYDGTFEYSPVAEVSIGSAATGITLYQNYPNPFNPSTEITYGFPEETHVKLAVYDRLGREVKVLANGWKAAGTYTVTFDAAELPSGMYFYRIETGKGSVSKKMVLMK